MGLLQNVANPIGFNFRRPGINISTGSPVIVINTEDVSQLLGPSIADGGKVMYGCMSLTKGTSLQGCTGVRW